MVNIEGIKQLLSEKDNAEIRMGFGQFDDMDLSLNDNTIIELFREGIAVDIIIKNAGEYDNLPKRLERHLESRDGRELDIDEGFVKAKIIDLESGKPLDTFEMANCLLNNLPNNFRVRGELLESNNPDEDGFVKIIIISTKEDKFLSLQDIKQLFGETVSPDKYQFIVEELK